MVVSAHELPQPHDPENGVFDTDVENVDELEPDYEAEETNAKNGDYEPAHAAPAEDTPPVDAAPEVPEEKNEEEN